LPCLRIFRGGKPGNDCEKNHAKGKFGAKSAEIVITAKEFSKINGKRRKIFIESWKNDAKECDFFHKHRDLLSRGKKCPEFSILARVHHACLKRF
jgi:hypothetical protein